jgi:hypothetical protein
MNKLLLLLSLCALACSTSGTPPPAYPAEPVEPDPSAEAAPPEVAAGPDQPAAAGTATGNADTCSAVCDRVASCQLASKEQCMPVCTPQMPQLTAEQQAQVIPTITSLPCDELAQFGAQSGSGAPAAAPPVSPEAEQGGEDAQGS